MGLGAAKHLWRDGMTTENPAFAHAHKLLTSKSVTVTRVVGVAPDAISYLGEKTKEHPEGEPMTAWLRRSDNGKRLDVRYERGFPASENPYLEVVHSFYPSE